MQVDGKCIVWSSGPAGTKVHVEIILYIYIYIGLCCHGRIITITFEASLYDQYRHTVEAPEVPTVPDITLDELVNLIPDDCWDDAGIEEVIAFLKAQE